ncbi:hypothetical protein [Streptomyces formicae]|uniref:Integral membrane protein n=1 Tax=Streptomyces formicae TaxID=1616117 RepID=A0ABY3WG71_9ACTN|nr:hypothetical protein [Streptomyces formicae]UNM11170.1 hypothetical protein J4032_06235 [Streptomyces formicae]
MPDTTPVERPPALPPSLSPGLRPAAAGHGEHEAHESAPADERLQKAGEKGASGSGTTVGGSGTTVGGSGTTAGGSGTTAAGGDKRAARSGNRRSEGRAADRKKPSGPRRGPADPVKALMHRHRELCERAVDPLEIAAGLEAHGVTDRTAARFRHRDVFSLAEELYARVPRGEANPPTAAEERPGARPGAHLLRALLPGTVAALAAVAWHSTSGGVRTGVGAAAGAALAGALAYSLRRGPLRAAGRTVGSARLSVCWLLAYAVAGAGLLEQLTRGGVGDLPSQAEGDAWAPAPGSLLVLALAVAPAVWSAQLFSAQARRRLRGSRGLEEFAAGARPLLLVAVTLYAAALTVVTALTGIVVTVDPAPVIAVGMLLFLARLLTVHGFPEPAAAGLAAAAAVEALALAGLLGGRLPGCAFLARPAEAATAAWGAGAVPAIACGAAALGLLVHATAALSRASAHTP